PRRRARRSRRRPWRRAARGDRASRRLRLREHAFLDRYPRVDHDAHDLADRDLPLALPRDLLPDRLQPHQHLGGEPNGNQVLRCTLAPSPSGAHRRHTASVRHSTTPAAITPRMNQSPDPPGSGTGTGTGTGGVVRGSGALALMAGCGWGAVIGTLRLQARRAV